MLLERTRIGFQHNKQGKYADFFPRWYTCRSKHVCHCAQEHEILDVKMTTTPATHLHFTQQIVIPLTTASSSVAKIFHVLRSLESNSDNTATSHLAQPH